jgi:long-chain acyl-CoA synthetase
MPRPWTAFYEPGVPPGIEVPKEPLDRLLTHSARRFPDKRATVFSVNPRLPAGRMTYRRLDELASRFACGLQQLGVAPGERVALMLPNSIQYVVAFFGALRAGAVVVNTNPLFVGREIREQWSDAGATTAVILADFFPRLREVQADTPVRRVVVTQIEDFLPPPTRWLVPFVQRRHGERVVVRPAPAVHSLVHMLRRYPPTPQTVPVLPDDLALLQYTGGTTGTPKGAALSHTNLQANVAQVVAWFRSTEDGKETFFGALPFFHVYGLTVGMLFSIAKGGTLVAIPRPTPVETVIGTIVRYRCSIFPGVPALYAAIVNCPDAAKLDLSSIKACLSGAAALPAAVQERFEQLTGGKLVEGYGLSETSPVTHANPIDGVRVLGSIGIPLPSTDAKVIALDTEAELGPDEEGELAVAGPQVMRGYWRRDEENRTAFTADGFFRTGDIARRNAAGFFFIVDRKKDIINTGGFKVVPREVEEVFFRHPAVADAVVVGVRDALRGEAVKAFVVLRPGAIATEEELLQYCRLHLASYKVPRAVEFRSEIPKTAVGKALRRVLAAEEAGHHEHDAG